jgi:hypothetical protein
MIVQYEEMKLLLKISILIIILNSCHKEKHATGSEVEMYLLQAYQLETGKCKVDPSSAVLEEVPVVSNDDILEYSRSTYSYKLSNSAFLKVKALHPRTPFAITVDKKVIFFGIYMPLYMSSTCAHSITMYEMGIPDKEVFFELGYPGLMQGVTIDDQRNNDLIIQAFRKQGKLR